MSDFRTRLIDEKEQLDQKIGKLNDFRMSEKISEIDQTQATLLNIQYFAMQTYSQCLLERIVRLEPISDNGK